MSSVYRSHEGQPIPSYDAFPTTSPVPTCVSPVSTSQHATQKGEKPAQVGHSFYCGMVIALPTLCLYMPVPDLLLHLLVMQQRAPVSQGGLKEETLPPSPVMRGEPFNPAMRPDHHKHPDNKPPQPGQQSEYQDMLFFLWLSVVKMHRKNNNMRVCVNLC